MSERPLPHTRTDGFPRRRDILLLTPLELQIRECVLAVEQAGADPILTEASCLIQNARMLIADWLEATPTEGGK